MTPFARWLRSKAEKWIGTFYEGPEPPDRIDQLVAAFVEMYPNATRGEWIKFAIEHGREAYRSGYQRGAEYTERTDDWHPQVPPEVVADAIDPDWRWRPMDRGIEYGDAQPVTDEPDERKAVASEIARTVQSWVKSRRT